MNREFVLTLVIFVGGGLAFLLLFLLVRTLLEASRKLFAPKQDTLIAESLSKHLSALSPAQTLGESIDRWFERIVGRSELAMSPSLAVGYLLLVGVLVGTALFMWQEKMELALAGAIAGMLLLLLFFWVMHWRWKRKVQEQLPDTFHLMARSLRAGLTVDQSVELIATQGQQPLAAEFKRCSEHLKLGLTVPSAFRMTADRLQLPDFGLLVSLIVMHRQTGGNLALLVDRLAMTIRSRNQFRGQVAAVTALGRLSGFFIALGAPMFLVFYWFLYPDYLIRLTESPQGMTALVTAGILEVVGVTWLLWLLRVDY